MSEQDYDQSLSLLLQHEGGYTNNPADPGGPTNFGITINDYRRFIDANGTANDVKNMTVTQAATIYKGKYWDAMRCDELPAGVDYAVFDYGVNSGISRSKKVLQRVLGVHDDGVLGVKTMEAIAKASAAKTINGICDERIAFLQRLRTWPVFGKGWSRRVTEVRAAALMMAAGAPVRVNVDKTASGKAPKESASVTTKSATATATAATAGAAAAQSNLPWWAIAIIMVAVGVVAFVAIHFISKED